MENTIVDHAPEAQLVDTPGVRIPPPLPFIATFLVGWLIQSRFPLPFLVNPFALIAGSLLLVCWAALVVTSIPTMIRRGGTLNTSGPSRALVTSGVYRVTRNPMYLSLVLGYIGVACLTRMLWPLILVPLPLLYSQFAILREERYLERRFGAAYVSYASHYLSPTLCINERRRERSMSVETEAYLRLFSEGFSAGNLAVVDELVSPDYQTHQRGLPHGPAGVKAVIQQLREWFSDFTLTPQAIVQDGDTVWGRNKGRGTNTGSVMGHPPSGVQIEVDVVDIIRFHDGKMVEHWGVPDQLGMLEQVGVFPQR